MTGGAATPTGQQRILLDEVSVKGQKPQEVENSTQVTEKGGGTNFSSSDGNTVGRQDSGFGSRDRAIKKLKDRRDRLKKEMEENPSGWTHPYNSVRNSLRQESIDNLDSRIADLKAGRSRGVFGSINDGVTDFGDTIVEGAEGVGSAVGNRVGEVAGDFASGDPNRIVQGYANRTASDFKAVGDALGGAYKAVTTPSEYFQGARDSIAAGDYGGAGAQIADYLSTAAGGAGLAKGLAMRAGSLVSKGAMTVEEAAALRKMSEADARKAIEEKEAAEKAARDRVEREKREREENGKKCIQCSGTPVSLCSGAKITFDREFVVEGMLPIELSRSYASDMAFDGPLGRNRIGPLDEVLIPTDDGLLVYLMGEGLRASFKRPVPDPGSVSLNAKHRSIALAPGSNRSFTITDRGISKRFEKFRDGVWRLAEIRNRNDHVAILERSALGVLTELRRSDGFRLHFENDENGLRRSVTLRAPGGEIRLLLHYDYDANGNLIFARNAFGASFTYRYDEQGRFVAYDDGIATRNQYRYDASSRVTEVITRQGFLDYTIEFDPANARSTLISSRRPDDRTTFTFDENQQTTSRTNGLGYTEHFERDADGALLARIDGEGNATRYRYDENGFLKSVTDPEGRETILHHDRDGQPEVVRDTLGRSHDWGYDEKRNLVWTQDAVGTRTEYVNNEAGLPTRIMRADGLMQSRRYDAQHRLTDLVDFRGERTRFERDAFGRITAVTDPLGAITRYAYDEAEGCDFWRPSAMTRPDGITLTRIHEAARARVAVTDGEGRRTIYRYGELGLLSEIEDPKGGCLRFGYDHERRLIQVDNQKGLVWILERDAAGRVVRERDFDGLEIGYAYDRADRVTEMHYPDGGRRVFAYDRSGLLVSDETWTVDAQAPEVTRFRYDERGLLAEAENGAAVVVFERDRLGRVSAETLNGRRVESIFDCCGNRVERRIGERLVASLYDPLGGLREIAVDAHVPLRFARDGAGRETSRSSESGFRLDQDWDRVGQLLRQRVGGSLDRSYAWDRAFAPASIADGLWGALSYGSDAAGQIVETRFGDGGSERFSYDVALNLDGFGEDDRHARFWRTAASGRVHEACGPQGERIGLTYDLRHRVIERRVERDGFRPKLWRYGWDGRGRLVSCETPSGERWLYGYDPFGRRVSKVRVFTETERAWVRGRFPSLVQPISTGGRSALDLWPSRPAGASETDPHPPVVGVSYLWDGDVVAEEAPLRLDGTVQWDRATRWHYEPGGFRPLAKEGPDGALAYIVTDHLGTPRELFDEGGELLWAAEYRTWGTVRRLWVAEADNDNTAWARGGPSPRGGGRTYGSLALKDDPDAIAALQHCPIRFQGQWQDDETGLAYNRFRYYDALTAQYLSPDPIGLRGGPRPQSYVLTPITFVDPFGLAENMGRLQGIANQIRQAGLSPQSINSRTIAVGMTENGTLYAGSSNGFDAGMRAKMDELGVQRVQGSGSLHAEEELMRAQDRGALDGKLTKIGTDARAPCGPSEHNCAQQMQDRDIDTENNRLKCCE